MQMNVGSRELIMMEIANERLELGCRPKSVMYSQHLIYGLVKFGTQIKLF